MPSTSRSDFTLTGHRQQRKIGASASGLKEHWKANVNACPMASQCGFHCTGFTALVNAHVRVSGADCKVNQLAP